MSYRAREKVQRQNARRNLARYPEEAAQTYFIDSSPLRPRDPGSRFEFVIRFALLELSCPGMTFSEEEREDAFHNSLLLPIS